MKTNKKMKRLTALALVMCLLATMLPTVALAADTISGSCGDNLTWILDESQTLTISGTGAMDNWSYDTMLWPSYRYPVKTVIIEDGVTTIGDYAFYECYTLTSVVIPDSITYIGNSAFANCNSLISIKIPDSVTSIGNYAFASCYSLSSIVIPNSVTCIKDCTFSSCISLSNVTIPDSITTIGNNVFYDCKNLTDIMIPASVITIDEPAFSSCKNLNGIWVDANNPNYSSDDEGVLFNKSKTELIQVPGALNGNYTIPDGVNTIGNSAFFDCTGLTGITIPDSVTTIGSSAFFICKNLQSITIPDSVTTIGNSAFGGCNDLTNIAIPDSVTSIGWEAFSGTNINYNFFDNGIYLGNNTNPYYALIDITSDSITSCEIHPQTQIICAMVFESCSNLTNITIPDCVIAINCYAFAGCSGLQSITIPNNVTTIDECAFAGCTSLTSITIQDGVTTIGDHAFNNCTSLISITIPESVTYIGDSAFYNCESLQNISIPNSIITIGDSVFSFCFNLTYNEYNGCAYLGNDTNPYVVLLYTTSDVITSYEIHSDTRIIGRAAFSYCEKLESIIIPESIISIDEGAFYECSSLTTVYYSGTEEQINSIDIKEGNNYLINAEWKYAKQEPETDFADVGETSWQYAAATYAVERNLMAGKGTDAFGRIKFDPNSTITREEFVQVLYNAENKPSVIFANNFPDVVNNAWYKNAVLWANSKNIANGMGDGRFGVGMNITRQDLALMLYKYAAMKNLDLTAPAGEINQYADDSQVSGYAQTAMNWAVENGVLSGKGTAGADISTFRLDPTGTATRAECAAMLKNFMTAFGL